MSLIVHQSQTLRTITGAHMAARRRLTDKRRRCGYDRGSPSADPPFAKENFKWITR
jgi:hypothetical protein